MENKRIENQKIKTPPTNMSTDMNGNGLNNREPDSANSLNEIGNSAESIAHDDSNKDNLDSSSVQETESNETEVGQDASDEKVADQDASARTDKEQTEEVQAEEEQTEEEKLIAQLQEQLAEEKRKAEQSLDRLQRTAAEFQNSKKRQEKLLSDSIERASARMIERLLPVLDDLDLAFRNVPADVETTQNAWLSGFQQIQKKLLHILEEEEVTAMTEDGSFDPSKHEAVSSEPNEEVESGHIIETLRLGYEHKGRVLRPALVRVAT
ncbi:nucleotide exchange factor GrpE [Chloroflexi bacterium TSY]|nr:nucleotide exchange factor GrpE [Chloroflexi bacterium TSY]